MPVFMAALLPSPPLLLLTSPPFLPESLSVLHISCCERLHITERKLYFSQRERKRERTTEGVRERERRRGVNVCDIELIETHTHTQVRANIQKCIHLFQQ